ncbi:two-CW domain-containing protein [Thermodesulfobacteriota bacterium]
MERMNCWDVKQCGRGPSNDNSAEDTQALCPAGRTGKYDGINGGTFAGRFCWAIAGTFCAGCEEQGAFAQKFRNCLNCNFLQQVDIEEGRFMILTPYEVDVVSSEDVYW